MNTRTNRAPRHPVLILAPTLEDRDTAAADEAARRYLDKKSAPAPDDAANALWEIAAGVGAGILILFWMTFAMIVGSL